MKSKIKKFVLGLCFAVLCFAGAVALVGCEKETPVLDVTEEPIHQHEYEQLVVLPTCTEVGYEIEKCKTCEDISAKKVLNKVEHKFELSSLLLEHETIENCGEFKCADCDETLLRTITHDDIGMPILSFYGSMEGISKEDKVTIAVEYESEDKSFESDATLKWQGASSLAYEKKNYNITFLKTGTTSKNKVTLVEEWGNQSKYTLKANWIDFSHSRNIVSANLYNQVTKTRDLEDEISKLSNGGAIDGFPIVIYHDGNFEGLYTLNIPKDDWMFGMEEDEEGDDVEIRHAALATNSWSDDVFLKKEIETFENGDFEVEFCSTEDTIGDEWVLESFNNLIRFVNESSDEEFVEQIGNYVNLERTIDSMLFTSAIFAPDNIAKNIIWLTYDGVHWFSSVYDLDSTWGLHWAGTEFYIHNHDNVNASSGNNLWRRIFALYEKEVVKRYFELRTSVLTIENISNNFEEFDSQISLIIKTAEIEKWQDIPSKETNNITQIIEYAKARLNFLDDVMLAYL